MAKSLPFVNKPFLIAMLALTALSAEAGLVKNTPAYQVMSFSLADSSSNGIAINENTRTSIALSTNDQEKLRVNTNNELVNASIQNGQLLIEVGEVEQDTSVSLSLVNEQGENAYSLAVTVLNVLGYSKSNYADLSLGSLSLSSQADDFESFAGIGSDWSFAQQNEPISWPAASAVSYDSRLVNTLGSAQYAGFSGYTASVTGNNLAKSSVPEANLADDNPAYQPTLEDNSEQSALSTMIAALPKYQINYQPATLAAGAPQLTRYQAPYKQALEIYIAEVEQTRQADANDPELSSDSGNSNNGQSGSSGGNSGSNEDGAANSEPGAEGQQLESNDNAGGNDNEQEGSEPNQQPQLIALQPDISLTPENETDGSNNQQVVQVAEPSGVVLFLLALLALLLFPANKL